MDEDTFRKMLDTLLDGLWYNSYRSDGYKPLLDDNTYEAMYQAVLSHIGDAVRGTPAEAWLQAWKEKKPPTYEPKPGEVPTVQQLLHMPRERRNAYLKTMGDIATVAGLYDEVDDE